MGHYSDDDEGDYKARFQALKEDAANRRPTPDEVAKAIRRLKDAENEERDAQRWRKLCEWISNKDARVFDDLASDYPRTIEELTTSLDAELERK